MPPTIFTRSFDEIKKFQDKQVVEEFIDANSIENGTEIALREKEGFLLGILTVSDVWTPDKKIEAEAIYHTTDTYHPGVNNLINSIIPAFVQLLLLITDLTLNRKK